MEEFIMKYSFSKKGKNNSILSGKGVFSTENNTPIVKVGISDSENNIDFKIDGRFLILDKNNNVIMDNIKSDLKWRIKVENAKKAEFKYGILLKEFVKKENAEKFAKELNIKNFDVIIDKSGTKHIFSDEIILSNLKYKVIAGYWESEEEAKKCLTNFGDDFNYKIIKQKVAEPQGKLEIFDSNYDKSIEKEDMIFIVPKSDIFEMTLFNVDSLKYNRKIDKKLKGKIQINLNNESKISVINVLPIDEFLKEVLINELMCESSYEFLKAYAIAARGFYLFKLGLKTNDNDCDFYSEQITENLISPNNDAKNLINGAVEKTKGLVITSGNNVCNSVYTLVCGGCTENFEGFYGSNEIKILPGIFDTENKKNIKFALNFDSDKKVEKWLNDNPEVFCNVGNESEVRSISSFKKYFRWEISYIRNELERIIKEKSGNDIGILYDIIPISRGVSGRIKEIEILGSKRNIIIRDEENIKQIFSNDKLYGTCFNVNFEVGNDGVPIEFTFKGAGYGQGVGMCLLGALVMAEKKYKCESILNHYYGNVSLRKVY